MIHQLIFAYPKPGMSEEEFQRYWLDVHAVQYASKIPQIRKYLIDTRLPWAGGGEPKWSGVAEIWLANEEEQLASLQTEEFLQGARLDEPRWAAFWRTVVLDTDAHVVVPAPSAETGTGVKLIRLVKRREGVPLASFREQSLGKHAELVRAVPGLRGYLQGHTRDGAYAVGEALLDAAYQLWFDSVESLDAALASPEFQQAEEEMLTFVEPRYVHQLATREHWIIGPDPR
ncbi:EthD domain-containing protein [Micromonospora sp. NBS 11-29]|uniref:EthD domain-containing protein n=1 Tax=Micromonospora sp. NBS 11-29 TaxID=1960879 RepID=UPI000B7975EC|nr:EthD family reductase [Micromonospora sp. NBS 11-29]